MSRRILLVHGTRYGQTTRIADHIADVLRRAGTEVVSLAVGDVPRAVRLAEFDGVVVGASVISGRHQWAIARFARRHRDALNAMPSAFFSVSASAASHDARGRAAARGCLSRFLRETGWYPPLTETIAGRIDYRRYNPLLRWWMRRICARAGGPTDTSRDHELTDWAQVDRFARSVAMGVRAPGDVHEPVLLTR